MTTNRFVKNQPSASVSSPIAPVHISLPVKCEITDCETRYVPSKDGRKGRGNVACGLADVFVKDHKGNTRGICATHYTRELVSQGKASNQDIVDADGRLVESKIKDLQESEQLLLIKPAYHGQPKGPQQFQVPEVVQRVLEQDSDDAHVSDDEFFADHERDRGYA